MESESSASEQLARDLVMEDLYITEVDGKFIRHDGEIPRAVLNYIVWLKEALMQHPDEE